ncbi:cytochrome P450 [Streptomyces sp. NPDC002588]|uniref:cytochrome P450 n=1 Tax=Streptomyces sp. NPDC002588 TaxID=3154419 RepID=UPI00333058AD
MAHSEELGAFDILLRYVDVKNAAKDWKTFSSRPSAVRPVAARARLAIDWDPPEHTAWRKIVDLGVDATTPDRIEGLVEADTVSLIDSFASKGECDLVADYCEQVPLQAICHILGFDPEHKAEIRRLSGDVLASLKEPERLRKALGEFSEIVAAPVLGRRGKEGRDFLTLLANAEMNGRPLDVQEITDTMVSLLLAGHETTVSGLSSLLYEVLRRPEVRDRLIADPDLIPAAVEEALRLHPPVFGFYRRVTSDVNIAGVDIAENSTTYLCWAAANRDPERFTEPDEFRLDRGPARHLTFGFGIHTCPGQAVARMEMNVAVAELLKRLPDIRLATDDIRHEFRGSETESISSLPAVFTPTS